eukprot:553873_1
MEIQIIYEHKKRKKRFKWRPDSIHPGALRELRHEITQKWKRYDLEWFQLEYENVDSDGEEIDDTIDSFVDLQNAVENTRNRKKKLKILVYKEDPPLSDKQSQPTQPTKAEQEIVSPKAEQKQVEEEKEIHYEISNPLVICIGISKYENLEPSLLGCEKNTEMMLKLLVN